MEKRGIRTEKGDLNRWIKKFNQMYKSLQTTIAALKEWIQEAKEILKEPEEVLSLIHISRGKVGFHFRKTALLLDSGHGKKGQREDCTGIAAGI